MFAKIEIVDNVKTIIPLTKKEVTGAIPTLDSYYPIGYVYTQYPQQAAPSDLFPTFTWAELNYDSAFFRASGGNADAFITSSGTLTPQSQTTAKNNLKINKSGGVSTGHIRANVESARDGHTHTVYLANSYAAGSYNAYGTYGGLGPLTNDPVLGGTTSTDYWNHRHYFSFTPSVSDNISATISGDTETRPTNYTIKVWVRTA